MDTSSSQSSCIYPAAAISSELGHQQWIPHEDQRFLEKKKNEKKIRCDACGDWKEGINKGSFKISPQEIGLLVRDRKRAWETGAWNATWYLFPLTFHQKVRTNRTE